MRCSGNARCLSCLSVLFFEPLGMAARAAGLKAEGGICGGQLTNWIVTKSDRFKAAIPIGAISNLISFNYLPYYHDYLAVEFGAFAHENDAIDRLWERSPIRYARQVKNADAFDPCGERQRCARRRGGTVLHHTEGLWRRCDLGDLSARRLRDPGNEPRRAYRPSQHR